MKMCDTLSKSIDMEKAKANRPAKEVSVTLSAPVRPQPQQIPEETVQVQVRQIETLSPSCKAAIDEFNRIYTRYLNLTKMDVWTGKSNEVVNAWSAWCNNPTTGASQVASAVTSSSGNPPNELRDIVSKYNTFGNDLSSKINQWALTQYQTNFISRFSGEHDDIYNGFKRSTHDLSICEDYHRRLQKLCNDLDDLKLHGHPAVTNALEITHDSLRNMVSVINQLKIDPRTKITFTDSAKPKQPEVTSSTRALFCSECGSRANGTGRFCANCGASLDV